MDADRCDAARDAGSPVRPVTIRHSNRPGRLRCQTPVLELKVVAARQRTSRGWQRPRDRHVADRPHGRARARAARRGRHGRGAHPHRVRAAHRPAAEHGPAAAAHPGGSRLRRAAAATAAFRGRPAADPARRRDASAGRRSSACAEPALQRHRRRHRRVGLPSHAPGPATPRSTWRWSRAPTRSGTPAGSAGRCRWPASPSVQRCAATCPDAGYVAERDRAEPDVTAIAAPVLRPGGVAGALSACSALPTASTRQTMHDYGAASCAREAAGAVGARSASRTRPSRRLSATMITFESVTKRYPDGTVAVDELSLVAPSRPDHRARRPVGLRQDDQPADDQPDDRADRRAGSGSTTATPRSVPPPSCAAASATSSSTPGCSRTAPSLDNVATVPLLLGQDKQKARARALELLERVGLPPALRQALPRAAVRRAAAARRRRPGAGRRPAGDADGRAVQRRRPGRARAAAGRVPAAAGRAGQDDRVRHPRHRRGDQARRPGRGAARRRQAGPARHARRAAVRARPTPSSPASSGATAATARSASPPPGAAGRARSRPSRSARRCARARDAARDGWVLVVDDQAPAAGLARAGRLPRQRADRATSRPTCSTSAARSRPRAARCARRSTPRCPRRPGAGWSSTTTAALLGTVTAPRRSLGQRIEQQRRDRGGAVSDGRREPLGRRRPQLVARGDFSAYFQRPPQRVSAGCGTHVWLSVLPVVVGLLIALPLGWLARRYRWVYPPMVTITGLLYTIPSIALFVADAAAARHRDPRPDQRRRRADRLLASRCWCAWSPTGSARCRTDVAQAATAMGFTPAAAAVPGRAADRRAGHRRRAAGRRGVQRQPGRGRRHDRRAPSSASCSPPASSCRRRRTTRRSCSGIVLCVAAGARRSTR